MKLVVIDAPHFYAAITVDDEYRVVEAAPILRYMLGWSGWRVRKYIDSKGWRVAGVFEQTPEAP